MKAHSHWLFAEQAAICCFYFMLDIRVHPDTLRKFITIIDAFLTDAQANPRYQEDWHVLRALIVRRVGP